MILKTANLLFLVAFLLVWGPEKPGWAQDSVSKVRDAGEVAKFARKVPFKKVGDVELNLHVFQPERPSLEDRRPAIVFFFGGGWVGGTPTQFYRQAWYLSHRGMVAICAEYRVQSRNQTTPRECVKDGKSAIRYVREHAAELGVDPDRIVAAGGSAGGHVAAATATLDKFNEETDNLEVSCRPQALVLFNPVSDNGPEGWGHAKVKDYWQDISPRHNLKQPVAPTLFLLGDKDNLVPVEVAETFQRRVEELGGRCELIITENAGHGYFNKGEAFFQTLEDTDRFLVSLELLQGPPRVRDLLSIENKPAPPKANNGKKTKAAAK